MTVFTPSASNPIASIAKHYLEPITKDAVQALTLANLYADFVLTGGIFPNYWHNQAIEWFENHETNQYPEKVNEGVTLAIVLIHEHIKNVRLTAILNAEQLLERLEKGEMLQPLSWQQSFSERDGYF